MAAQRALALLVALPIVAGNIIYKASPAGKTASWQDAVNFCQSEGGFLAAPSDAAANGAIHVAAGAGGIDGQFWVAGALRNMDEWCKDAECWVTFDSIGAPVNVTFTQWAKKEPNNWGRNEKCIRAGNAGNTWNDAKCSLRHPFVCGYDGTFAIKSADALPLCVCIMVARESPARQHGKRGCPPSPSALCPRLASPSHAARDGLQIFV